MAYEHDGNFEAAVRAYGEECDHQDLSMFSNRIAAKNASTITPDDQIRHQADPDSFPTQSGATGSVDACIGRPVARGLPTPFEWMDPSLIPPRPWLYGRHLLRQQVSVTVAPGGLGKSSNSIVEALAMVAGRPLVGEWV